ncbi:MAG: peptide ABC transporter substrate-binding protein [Rhodospirillales bacterium]|nr:peptide ABC transporter substrate-binding protein [Rhodospirillales bacterium]
MKWTRALLGLPIAASAFALMVSGGAEAAGKIVTVVLSEEPDVIDPCEATRSNVGRIVKQNITETLTFIDPKTAKISPKLAIGWKQMNDLTWRISLRKGVKFHDGADFNAASAKKAIERTLNPKSDCEIRLKMFGNVKMSVKVVDDYTIDISTEKTQPILPTMLGTMTITGPNMQPLKGDRQPVGTGPYKFIKWVPGQEVLTARFDGYWGAQPEAVGARYIFRKESAVRAAMVKAGEADIAPNIALQDATDKKMDFGYFNSETTRLRIDTSRAPLDDIRVRKAMNYAIDRSALIGSIFSEDVVNMTNIVVPSIPGHNPALKVWPYDPAMAKKLLAEAKAAGVKVDTEIVMLGRLGIYPNATEAMEAMHAMLSEVGFNVKLKMVEVSQWVDIFTKPFAEDRGPVLQQGQHDNNNGDPVFSVFFKYACDGPQSTTCDKQVDDGIAKASATAAGPARSKAWQDVFARIHELAVDVQMFHMIGYSRVNPRLNFTPSISTNSEVHIAEVKFN